VPRAMRRSLLTLAVAATAALLPSGAAVAAPPATAIDALYVVNTAGGSFDGRVLTLRGVAPAVAWFADRPARVSGVEPMRAATRQLFTGAAPNAALDLAGGDDRVYAVTLRRPVYDARARTLRYRVTTLPSLTSTKLGHLEERRTSVRIPRTFGSGSLFIDDGEVEAANPPLSTVPTVSDTDYLDKVIGPSRSRPVAVGFCNGLPNCEQTFGPRLVGAAQLLSGTVAMYYVDASTNPEFTQKYIGAFPAGTLVFAQGGLVGRLNENLSAQAIADSVKSFLPG
jgi:hypothetical protein